MKQSTAESLLKDIRNGLLKWYDFRENAKILYIGEERDSYMNIFKENGMDICVMNLAEMDEVWAANHTKMFDYIVCVSYLEKVKNPSEVLQIFYQAIKPEGHLLLGMNNRLGLRYFCGDKDPYTKRNFDGIEEYKRMDLKNEVSFHGRCYSKCEIQEYLQSAGWTRYKFFSIISGLENPVFLYADNYFPNEDLSSRVFPTYNSPDTIFLEEENLYKTLMKEELFHKMPNAFLVDCSIKGDMPEVSHITVSMERGRKNALFTMIYGKQTVVKKAVYPDAKEKLNLLHKHAQELEERGLCVVQSVVEHEVLKMPYIKAKTGQEYLRELLRTDVDMFFQELDHFRDTILQSSEIAEADKGDGNGARLAKGYFDLVPLNSFYIDGKYVFFDQEFCIENYPANVLIWRMINSFYFGDVEAAKILPMDVLLERYDLQRKRQVWIELEHKFFRKLRNEEELCGYHQKYRRDLNLIHSNRQRLNYSADEYQRLFVDIFKNADTRKLILFGSGNFTRKFLALYKEDYPVYAIIDNNQEKWGQKMEGISIEPPEILNRMQIGEYKVIICIKNYLSVMEQLKNMGVHDYAVYDWNKDYPKKLRPLVTEGKVKSAPKKYHIGYVAGVFDMFHVGHVNLLRKAKEQCDYLIVGVVPDNTVYKQKNKYPVISAQDRAEVLKSCRYADQVEILPENYAGIKDAYKMFHFDCQFSGDDHGDDSCWKADREYLNKVGADIVFFGYTEKVSSTMLREQLRKGEK